MESDLLVEALSGAIVARTSGSLQAQSFPQWIKHSICLVRLNIDDPIASEPDGLYSRSRNIDAAQTERSVTVCPITLDTKHAAT